MEKKIPNKVKDKIADQIKRQGEFEEMYTSTRDYLRPVHFDWLKNDAFVEGNHYIKLNKSTKKLVKLKRNRPSQAMLTINLIWQVMRAIRGFILRAEPTWEVQPKGVAPENIDIATKTSRFLRHMWDELGMKVMVGDMVFDGLKYSIGVLLLYWDERENKMKVSSIDPYDFFWDAEGTKHNLEDCSFAGHTFRATEDELRADPRFEIEKDLKLTSSGDDNENAFKQLRESLVYKKRTEQERRVIDDLFKNGKDEKKVPANKKLIGREIYYRKYGENGELEIWVATWLKGGNGLLRNEKTDLEFYPYDVFHADIRPRELVGSGWVKNMIYPQKALNRYESLRFEYLNVTGKTKILAPKGSNIKKMSDANAEIIYYDSKGYGSQHAPRQMTFAPLPNDINMGIGSMKRYIEDIGGAHQQFLGSSGFAGESGVHTKAIQSGDANNTVDLRLNLETFLSSVGYKILWFYEKYGTTPEMFTSKEDDGSDYWMKALSKKEYDKQRKKAVSEERKAEIKDNYLPLMTSRVKVTLGSWLSYNEDANFEKSAKLFELGVIDQRALLETVKYNNANEIIKRTELRQQEQAKQGIPPEGMGQPPQEGMPPQGGQPPMPQMGMEQPPTEQPMEQPQPQEGGIEQAMSENNVLMSNGTISDQGTPNAQPDHTLAHIEFMNTPEAMTMEPELMSLLLSHIRAESKTNGLEQEVEAMIQQAQTQMEGGGQGQVMPVNQPMQVPNNGEPPMQDVTRQAM